MNNVLKEPEALKDKGESTFESVKQKLSQAIESGSDSLIAGAEKIEGTALNSAESLMQGATYLRTQPASQMWADCRSLLTKYPVHAIAVAAIAGLFVGKSIWSGRQNR